MTYRSSLDRALFIRSTHRPDLRAVFATTPDVNDLSAGIASLPQPMRLSGCGEKNDKSDKTKEVGKDDKAHRAPVKDRRGGQCTYLATDQQLDAAPHDFIFA